MNIECRMSRCSITRLSFRANDGKQVTDHGALPHAKLCSAVGTWLAAEVCVDPVLKADFAERPGVRREAQRHAAFDPQRIMGGAIHD
ncbi:hypothetical protein, partial [Pontiella sp.]|uniref:hypothetical protein n=1 Tax=Pontiella sp. TaxID=2837462 RepID=UPI003563F188